MIEKEYIDLEEAVAALKRNSLKCFNSYYKGYVNAIEDLADIPAADVAPVRHGRWETGYFHDRVCSCCTHPDNDLEERAHRFCPHCGARMDGKEDE